MREFFLKIDGQSNSPENLLINQLAETDDSFTVFNMETGSEVSLGNPGENIIVFLLKGRIEIRMADGSPMTLAGGRMYSMSSDYTPYLGKVLFPSVYIVLKADSLLPYFEKSTILKIKNRKDLSGQELGALDIQKMLRFFLASVVFLKNNELRSNLLFNLKRQELIFIAKRVYDQSELIRFFIPALALVSEFRLEVLSKYTNSITVKELAEDCCMTPKTFTKYFKEEFGDTPHKWIIERKINSLNNFIFYQKASINDILKEFGFASLGELNKFCVRYQLRNILLITKSASKL